MGEGSMNKFVNMRMNGLNDLNESEIGSASLNTIEWIGDDGDRKWKYERSEYC